MTPSSARLPPQELCFDFGVNHAIVRLRDSVSVTLSLAPCPRISDACKNAAIPAADRPADAAEYEIGALNGSSQAVSKLRPRAPPLARQYLGSKPNAALALSEWLRGLSLQHSASKSGG